jgi:chromate transporter
LPATLLNKTSRSPDFTQALRFWWRLGWISFGGTAAHIAVLHDELVVKKQWIGNEEFLHALSHCMILPGPEAQQLAIYIGWKLHGKKGGLAAGSLFVLPSMFVILALSMIYVRFGNLPLVAAMISGLRPGIVALVVLALLRVARRTLVAPVQWLAAVAGLTAMAWFRASIPLVMLNTALLGLLVGWRRPEWLALTPQRSGHIRDGNGLPWWQLVTSAVRTAVGGFALWLLPLLSMYGLSRDFRFWRQLTLFFTQTAFVTIGGSYTVIPYVAYVAVTKYHWLKAAQMIDGFSLAETTPGPLIIVVAFVGFMAGFNYSHGSLLIATLALIATTFYTFLPCFLFVFAGAPFVQKTHGNPVVGSVLRMISAVVVAAMLNLTLFLIRGALFRSGALNLKGLDIFAVVWIAISLMLLSRVKVSLGRFVVLCLWAGLVRWSLAIR